MSLYSKKHMTVREWRAYQADDWQAFDAAMRTRLWKVPQVKQFRLLAVSKHLARRASIAALLDNKALLDTVAGPL
jgi:hypothetical protein